MRGDECQKRPAFTEWSAGSPGRERRWGSRARTASDTRPGVCGGLGTSVRRWSWLSTRQLAGAHGSPRRAVVGSRSVPCRPAAGTAMHPAGSAHGACLPAPRRGVPFGGCAPARALAPGAARRLRGSRSERHGDGQGAADAACVGQRRRLGPARLGEGRRSDARRAGPAGVVATLDPVPPGLPSADGARDRRRGSTPSGRPTWYRVAVPGRPNGRTGWIPAGAAAVAARRPLARDLPRLAEVRALRRRPLRRTGPVAVGARGMETPIGLFYVQSRFVPGGTRSSAPSRSRPAATRSSPTGPAAASSACTARTRRG